MEHIPIPQNAQKPIQVPLYDSIEYDGMGFWDFPRRAGFDLRRVQQPFGKPLIGPWLQLKTIQHAIDFLESPAADLSALDENLWIMGVKDILSFLHAISARMLFESKHHVEYHLAPDQISLATAAEFCLRAPNYQSRDQDQLDEKLTKDDSSLFAKLAAIVPHECGWITPYGDDWQCRFYSTDTELENSTPMLPFGAELSSDNDATSMPMRRMDSLETLPNPPSIQTRDPDEDSHREETQLEQLEAETPIDDMLIRKNIADALDFEFRVLHEEIKPARSQEDDSLVDDVWTKLAENTLMCGGAESLLMFSRMRTDNIAGANVAASSPDGNGSGNEKDNLRERAVIRALRSTLIDEMARAENKTREYYHDLSFESAENPPDEKKKACGGDYEDEHSDSQRFEPVTTQKPTSQIQTREQRACRQEVEGPRTPPDSKDKGKQPAVSETHRLEHNPPALEIDHSATVSSTSHAVDLTSEKSLAAERKADDDPTRGGKSDKTGPELIHIDYASKLAKVMTFLTDSQAALEFGEMRNEFGRTRHDALAFLQSWLFFGTLTEIYQIIEINFEPHKYIRHDSSGRQVLTTQYLKDDLDAWRLRESSFSTQNRAERGRAIDNVVNYASTVAGSFEEKGCPLAISEAVLPIRILCWTLRSFIAVMYRPNIHIKMIEKSFYLSWCFERDGWCPKMVNMMTSNWPSVVQYYAYLLGPSNTTHDHRRCSRTHCVVEQIDEQTYLTKHHSGCMPSKKSKGVACTEGSFEADPLDLASILEEGDIPLVSVSNPLLEKDPQPKIVAARTLGSDTLYVAISHVWADGIGNPRRNSLPYCQIIALRAYIAPLLLIQGRNQRQLHFWIDTLCVPLRPKDARDLAIIAMKETYAKATAVLVLDHGLMQHDMPFTSLETIARIALSDWNRRLWTFQEASITSRIHFRFRNASTWSFSDLIQDEDKEHTDQALALRHFIKSLLSWRQPNFYGFDRSPFMECLSGVAWRSTSKQSDQTICIGSLLDLDLKALLKTPSEMRMKKFFSIQDTFPASLVFINVPRIPDYGYCWAPLSLLNEMALATTFNLGESYVPRIDEGLLVQYHGFKLSNNQEAVGPNRHNIWHFDVEEHGEKDNLASSAIGDAKHAYNLQLFLQSAALLEEWPSYNPQSMAVIFRDDITGHTSHSGHTMTLAALVAVFRVSNDIIYTKFMCSAQLQRPQSFSREDNDHVFVSGALSATLPSLGVAEPVDYGQIWCVG